MKRVLLSLATIILVAAVSQPGCNQGSNVENEDTGKLAFGHMCEPLFKKGVLSLDFNPSFLHVDKYNDVDGLTISSFFNVNNIDTPWIAFERDLVARITNLDSLDYDNFNPSTDVERLTDKNFDKIPPVITGPPKTVWPNEAVRAPDGVFPFEALVIPQGSMTAGRPGRLSAINLDDPGKTEYIIHQSTQGGSGQDMNNLYDPENSPRFYNRVLFVDMDLDGLKDLVTTRSGLVFGKHFYLPLSELVYFKNPGAHLNANIPWEEHVLYNGPPIAGPPPPDAGLGPDFSLSAYDFEGDGIPEIVATHFFSNPTPPGQMAPPAGKIVIYGAPVGASWSNTNSYNIRHKVITMDQGYPFDIAIVDLNGDGKVDLLGTNHQPDNCRPWTTSDYPGRVFAFEQPASGDVFHDAWTLRVLLDDILPNPTVPKYDDNGQEVAQFPGKMTPGHVKTFWPTKALRNFNFAGVGVKPWILVSGDEASKVWVLMPVSLLDPDNWDYFSSVIFDINDYYGPGTTQVEIPGHNGITNSTIGSPAVRYDRDDDFGFAEIYIPAFEAKEIHVFSYRASFDTFMITCPKDQTIECSAWPPTPQ